MESRFEELREAVEKMELVDGHAHSIVALDSSLPFVIALSEAASPHHAPSSLSFKRNLKDIAQLYGTEASLDAVEEYRKSSGLESITLKCFQAAKISTILIDDGLQLDKMHGIEWHASFARVVGRILTIEHVAANILDEETVDGSMWTLDSFTKAFVGKLKSLADKIVGFKSIDVYRSGVEINTNVTIKDAEEGLTEVLNAGRPVRITSKSFIDYIFTSSLEIATSFDLPMQIHTGYGDKDLGLRLSNPLHLRTLLDDKRFSKCRIVLLHASSLFSKEAAYLASVYPQVYLDFRLAINKFSVHGMISSMKEFLELAPMRKVMLSTDGYAFPESFYLGARKSRDIIFSVLRDACADGDLSVTEAIETAEDIFALNAIKCYKINVPAKPCDSNIIVSKTSPKIEHNALQDVSFVRLIWIDASGQHRCRVVPANRFFQSTTKNGVGLTFACMGMTSHADCPAAETNLTGVGEIRLMPDLSTIQKIPWVNQEAMVLADMHLSPGKAWEYCPREALRRVTKVLKDEFNLVMNAGFENEFLLLKSVLREGKEEWIPIDSKPYCSALGYDAVSPIFHEIVAALDSLQITVEQLHKEAGQGQYEMAMGYTSCFNAADNLIFTREVIKAVARKHGLLATFVPKYALDDIGSGSHVHLSLWRDEVNVFMADNNTSRYGMSKIGEEFMAGVLHHLPSILAFTAPVPNSYDRIQPNTWSGAYQCWGRENRESPIRTACPPGISSGLVSNFEIKSFDGCANPYLGLAAIVAAGIDGLRRHLSLPAPIDVNPADVETELKRLPISLLESLEAVKKDHVLEELIGEKLLVAIKGIRKAEIEYYSKNTDAYRQLIHRY